MGFFSRLGGALGFGGAEGYDINPALAELKDLPEYQYLEQGLQDFGPSAMEQISLDPKIAAAQMRALEQLQAIGEAGGLTTADRAGLQEAADMAANQERGQREAIAQRARMQGLGGSGIDLARQLISSQGSTSRAAQEGRDVAQMAQARALAALQGAGTLGGQMRTQQYGEQADLAKARDLINEFNLRNKQAQAAERQRIAEQNVSGARNLASERSGVRLGKAKSAYASEDEQAQRLGQTVGGAIGILGKSPIGKSLLGGLGL